MTGSHRADDAASRHGARIASETAMSIFGRWLELPVWQLLLALAGFYATTGAAMHVLAYRGPLSEWTRSFRGVVPPFFAAVIIIFALLLGFVAGEVWRRNS